MSISVTLLPRLLPQDTGIDYLVNAGHAGDWWGLSCDGSGTPYVQGKYPPGSYAPFPGYYVSGTSYEGEMSSLVIFVMTV